MDATTILILALIGAAGGFVKSAFSHNGRIILPRSYNGGYILGSALDIGLGGVMGALSAEPLFYTIFHTTQPSSLLAFLVGFSAVVLIETLGIRFGVLEKINGGLRSNPSSPRRAKGGKRRGNVSARPLIVVFSGT